MTGKPAQEMGRIASRLKPEGRLPSNPRQRQAGVNANTRLCGEHSMVKETLKSGRSHGDPSLLAQKKCQLVRTPARHGMTPALKQMAARTVFGTISGIARRVLHANHAGLNVDLDRKADAVFVADK
jgi:hypothetical protein